jgi:lysozyme family protein
VTLFDAAVRSVLKHEGGLADHADDPGGLTNMGISLRAYPHLGREGIINLRREDAIDIYRRDYWAGIPEHLPDEVRWFAFDTAVNSGLARARAWLEEDATLLALVSRRLTFLAGLSTWHSFGRGWTRRIAGVLADINAWERGGPEGKAGRADRLVLTNLLPAERWAVLWSTRTPSGQLETVLRGRFAWRVRDSRIDVRRE